MRDVAMYLALIGVMGMSLLTLDARATASQAVAESQAVKEVCAAVDGDQSVHHYATDEVFFLLR